MSCNQSKSTCCKKTKKTKHCKCHKHDDHTIDYNNYSLNTVKVTDVSTFPCTPTSTNPDTGIIIPNSEAEPYMAVGFNPVNSSKSMVVICYQQDRYNRGGGCSANYMKISLDGGLTFGNAIALPDVTCFGGQFERTTDPRVSITSKGEILFAGDPYNNVNNYSCGVSIAKYNVLTGTFTSSQILNPSTGDATNSNNAGTDYPFLIPDPQDCTGNTAYMTWDRFWYLDANSSHGNTNLVFSKTTDGFNWSTPAVFVTTPALDLSLSLDTTVGLSDTYIGATTLALLENPCKSYSKIIACFSDFTGADYGAVNLYNLLYSCYSLNQGATWSTPILIDIKSNGGSSKSATQVVDPDTITTPDIAKIRSGDATPFVAADRKRNRLYVVSVLDSLLNLPIGIPSGLYLFVSLDGAQTWKPVGKINREQTVQAFNPSIVVLKNGDIAVTYYDFRNHAPNADLTAPLETDYWLDIFRYSKKYNTVTLIKEIRITPTSFNFRKAIPLLGGNALIPGGYFIGDYLGLESHCGKIYTSYGITNDNLVPNGNTDIYSTTISF